MRNYAAFSTQQQHICNKPQTSNYFSNRSYISSGQYIYICIYGINSEKQNKKKGIQIDLVVKTMTGLSKSLEMAVSAGIMSLSSI